MKGSAVRIRASALSRSGLQGGALTFLRVRGVGAEDGVRGDRAVVLAAQGPGYRVAGHVDSVERGAGRGVPLHPAVPADEVRGRDDLARTHAARRRIVLEHDVAADRERLGENAADDGARGRVAAQLQVSVDPALGDPDV